MDGREFEVARAQIYCGGDLCVSIKRWHNAGILVGGINCIVFVRNGLAMRVMTFRCVVARKVLLLERF